MAFAADTTTTAGNTTLSSGQAGVLLAVMIGGSIIAGIIIAFTRSKQRTPDGETQSVVRSWLAVSLVLGLLSTCAAAFEINDPQLRNTLLGGLVASTGAATAFYFSSKGADAARADILKTTTALARGVAPTGFSALSPGAPKVGEAYRYVFVSDGTPPVTYKLGSGNPPDGLSLEPDGELHGTPKTEGATTFTVVATNALGSVVSPDVTLTVAPAA